MDSDCTPESTWLRVTRFPEKKGGSPGESAEMEVCAAVLSSNRVRIAKSLLSRAKLIRDADTVPSAPANFPERNEMEFRSSARSDTTRYWPRTATQSGNWPSSSKYSPDPFPLRFQFAPSPCVVIPATADCSAVRAASPSHWFEETSTTA